eukprot:TRINITY_DN54_c2_g1_i1.p1 TRINITY_DN54_c2_g1~~TRINITY_DN54_c2_g1_i1.p1  ORF type:complete len:528 (+),score=134.02 TRINITY_DN54_c2_g1_i1:103-1686(+)
MSTRSFSAEEVAKHNKASDCWVVVKGKVYDVTKFLEEHPGGKKILLNASGADATAKFDQYHGSDVLERYANLCIGNLAVEGVKKVKKPKPAATADVSSQQENWFGEILPHADPAWYQGLTSRYYNESHKRFRAAVRDFVDQEIMPYVHEWDELRQIPRDLYKKAADKGILQGVVGAPWPSQFSPSGPAGDIKPEEYDYFHELILLDELCRCGSGGVVWALIEGLAIGLPPVLNFATEAVKERVCRSTLSGEKIICLCITEPGAGSDVANLQTRAQLTEDGKHYIVNGEKKWITNGVFADYFTVAVRTGSTSSGMNGISMLLIDRNMPGVKTRQMKCTGVWPSGTAYITFEDVKVPRENLIGRENQGFKVIMHNFNHERWAFVAQANRLARVCVEESIKWAMKRRTFGKTLSEHGVIRNKLGHMIRQVESTHAWLESLTLQMCDLPHAEQSIKLAGPIALLKAQSSQTLDFCAKEAAQIFGGLAYTRGGQGEKVERVLREVKAYAIPAGSEEIMLDLGVKQALRRAKL